MKSIYNNKFERVGIMSNEAENGIKYEDDELTTTINDGTYMLTFKSPKTTHKVSTLAPGNYIETYTPQGKQLLLSITDIDEEGTEKIITCEDTTIQALNSYVDAMETPKSPQRIDYYINHALERSGLEILASESTEALLLDFKMEQRILARLREIAAAFSVELDFDMTFSPGHPPKRYVSLLRQRIEDYKGFRVSSDDLLLGIERRVTTTNLATKVKLKGKIIPVPTTPVTTPSVPVPPTPAVDTFIEDVIKEAHRIAALKMRYQWGGNGNPSYDCSGFVQQCYKAAGFNPASSQYPRSTTYTMWAQDGAYKRTTKENLKRGDLIMYDTGYTSQRPNHVGIYLGGGLDAPNSVIHAGDPVGITQRANSMTITGYVTVVR